MGRRLWLVSAYIQIRSSLGKEFGIKDRTRLVTSAMLVLAVGFVGCENIESKPELETLLENRKESNQTNGKPTHDPSLSESLQRVSDDARIDALLQDWIGRTSPGRIRQDGTSEGQSRYRRGNGRSVAAKGVLEPGAYPEFEDAELLDLVLDDWATTKLKIVQSKRLTWLRCAIADPADLEWLANLKALKGLSIYGDFGENRTVKLSPLAQLENLKWLQIDFPAATLTDYPQLPKLEVLVLENANDQSLEWPGLSSLRALSLRHGVLSYPGFQQIARHFGNIKFLDLYSTHDLDSNSVVELEKLVNLRVLHLGLTGISHPDSQRLEAQLPNCMITSGD